MANTPRPLCRLCANRVPLGSFVWATFESGFTHLMHYCPHCKARAGSPIPKDILGVMGVNPDSLPAITVTAIKAETKLARLDMEGANAPQYTQEELKRMPYAQYLQTAHWKLLSEKVKRRAKYRCQLCNVQSIMNVHHRTYERRGHEYLKDLICLCAGCHAKFHDKLPKQK